MRSIKRCNGSRTIIILPYLITQTIAHVPLLTYEIVHRKFYTHLTIDTVKINVIRIIILIEISTIIINSFSFRNGTQCFFYIIDY